MINKVNMDGVQSYGNGAASVPKGGYVVEIKKVEVKQNRAGQYLEMLCDIAEGEYKDVFAADYRAQTSEPKKWHCIAFVNVPSDDGSERDGWTKRSFKTFYEALEASNQGYHFDWDETKIKGLKIGGLFAGREYEANDGSVRESVGIAGWTSVDNIRTGKYKLPQDKKLKNRSQTAAASDGFTPVNDSDLPF